MRRNALPANPGKVRLDRAISKLRLASRSEAQDLIGAGRVTVRGRVVRDPGSPVRPEVDDIRVNGSKASRPRWRTILLHKPRGVVTTRRDPECRPTVFDLLGADAHGLVAVGRLDMASTGLLLLTTDTRLAHDLTDPRNAVVRRYIVTVRGSLSDADARRIEEGIDGLKADAVVVRKRSNRETHATVELAEGKNREIRRLFEAVGHEVTRLKRTAFGNLELGTLSPGEWREVASREIESMSRRGR